MRNLNANEIRWLKNLTPDDIANMDYSELVALTHEINKPSGGIKTILRVLSLLVPYNWKILEVGSNTGFTSLEIARSIKSSIIGIDVNKFSIEEAKRNLKASNKLRGKVIFKKMDINNTKFKSNGFDFIWISNVLSFVETKIRALKEVIRLLKSDGYAVFVPIYYRKKPPSRLIKEISEIIGTDIKETNKNFWINLVERAKFKNYALRLVYDEDYIYKIPSKTKLKEFINYQINKEHLLYLSEAARKALKMRLTYVYTKITQNLRYCEYSILIFRKVKVNFEPELYPGVRIYAPISIK